MALAVMPYPLLTANELSGTTMLLPIIAAWLTLNAGLFVLLAYRQTAAKYIDLILTVFGAILIAAGNQNFLDNTNSLLFPNAIASSLHFTKPSTIWYEKSSASPVQ